MEVVVKGSTVTTGNGGGMARHNTRETEMGHSLDPEATERPRGLYDKEGGRPRVLENDDRFWTINMPEVVLREDPEADRIAAHIYGWESDRDLAAERLAREEERGHVRPLGGGRMDLPTPLQLSQKMLLPRTRLYAAMSPLERDAIRFRAFMDMRDMEESARPRRGRGKTVSGFAFVFSFNQPISNRGIRQIVDQFRETPMRVKFRKEDKEYQLVPNPLRDLPGGFAIHVEGTRKIHCHAQWDCRGADGVKAQIPPQVWKSLDEHFVLTTARYMGDMEIYRSYMKLKEETNEWKRDTFERTLLSQIPRDKPQRAADLRDQRAEKLQSQIRTDLKTLDLNPDKFQIAARLGRIRSNDETRMLIARAEVAKERFLHSAATGAAHADVIQAAEHAAELNLLLKDVLDERETKKKPLPTLFRTDKQTEEINRLMEERKQAAHDDRQTGYLLGYNTLLLHRLEREDSKAAEFEKSKESLEVILPGREPQSLEALHDSIATAKNRLLGLAVQDPHPSKEIKQILGQVEEFEILRGDLEINLSEREKEIRGSFAAAEWASSAVGQAIAETHDIRAHVGKDLPPGYCHTETALSIYDLAHENRDAEFVKGFFPSIIEYRLSPERREGTTAREVAREMTARSHLAVAEARHRLAIERHKEPAGEALAGDRTGDTRATEVTELEQAFIKARDYRAACADIAEQCLNVCGKTRSQITPEFTPDERKTLELFAKSIQSRLERQEILGALERYDRSRAPLKVTAPGPEARVPADNSRKKNQLAPPAERPGVERGSKTPGSGPELRGRGDGLLSQVDRLPVKQAITEAPAPPRSVARSPEQQSALDSLARARGRELVLRAEVLILSDLNKQAGRSDYTIDQKWSNSLSQLAAVSRENIAGVQSYEKSYNEQSPPPVISVHDHKLIREGVANLKHPHGDKLIALQSELDRAIVKPTEPSHFSTDFEKILERGIAPNQRSR